MSEQPDVIRTDGESWIQTHSGHQLDPFKPDLTQIVIDDIAHGLSMECRFANQLPWFYSVAEHSVRCMRHMWPNGATTATLAELTDIRYLRLMYEALMHDAHEAYIGDMAAPIKQKLPDYRMMADILDIAIRRKFGLSLTEPPAVREVDLRMLRTEAVAFKHNLNDWSGRLGIDGFDTDPREMGWTQRDAEAEFLTAFHAIVDQIREYHTRRYDLDWVIALQHLHSECAFTRETALMWHNDPVITPTLKFHLQANCLVAEGWCGRGTQDGDYIFLTPRGIEVAGVLNIPSIDVMRGKNGGAAE